jgi:hypothetical protein
MALGFFNLNQSPDEIADLAHRLGTPLLMRKQGESFRRPSNRVGFFSSLHMLLLESKKEVLWELFY